MNTKHIKLLAYAGTLFLAILSILAVVGTIFITNQTDRYNGNTISVTGTAEVSGAPDIATFSFTVSETADTAEQAQETISEKTTKILDGLDELSIDEADIETTSYAINPRYEWVEVKAEQQTAPDGTIYYPRHNGKNVLIGYDVSQSVTVTLRDLEKVSTALTLFAQSEVENLWGPNLTIDDPDGLQEEARLAAIKDAKAKAKRLAKDLDVKLGKIVTYYENNGGYYDEPMYADMAMSRTMAFDVEESFTPELPVGETDITASVEIIYEIK